MAVTKMQPKKKQPSRIVIYTLVVAVAAYAYVLQTTPDAKATHRTTHVVKKTASTTDDGITPEDLTAHFVRYKAGARDPFAPSIDIHPGDAPGVPGSQGGEWSLTGVNTINGVTTATVENPAAADSVFLKEGDRWNGLKVLQVNQDNVVFQNALGQATKLSFPGNDQDGTATKSSIEITGKGEAEPVAPQLPSITIVPMAVPSPPAPAPVQPADQSAGGDNGGGGGGG